MLESGNAERGRFGNLRGVRWRIHLGILPRDSSIDDLRRAIANRRRRYAAMRRNLLVDPHVTQVGTAIHDLIDDNPLSQNPDSTWGRFFRNAELEKTVDQDLSRLYPEHGSYFQTPGCQGMLRRILLLWSLRHQDYGYRQGMHELLAPLLYVLHVDLEHLSDVRKLHESHFHDKFDSLSNYENDATYNFVYDKFLNSRNGSKPSKDNNSHYGSLDQLDPEIQSTFLLSDPYGAEGELGIVLSEKFMEHDAYSMFDALMSGEDGLIAMAEFFSHVPATSSYSGLPFIIESSAAIYSLLSVIDSSLHTHLVELGVEPQYFALRWLRVLFGREFSLEDLLLIWDKLFAAENQKLERGPRDFAIANSSRGALIMGIAVSMMLHIRSSLLATENATICLQRLLNFPDNVDLQKLISKANSYQSLALDSATFSSVVFLGDTYDYLKTTKVKHHAYNLDASFSRTPPSVLPDSYWEEKWRVAHQAEDLARVSGGKQIKSPRKTSSEKSVARTKSDPGIRKRKPSVRRSLLEDLSRQLGMEKDEFAEEITNEEKVLTCVDGEENSYASIVSGSENDSGRSSVASNTVDEHDQADAAGSLPAAQTSPQKSENRAKERNHFLIKFQWPWKFGRNSSSDALQERTESQEAAVEEGHHQENSAESISDSETCESVSRSGSDQNPTTTLRNLGQSMIEHIQIVESAFQQERLESLAKNVLAGKGQLTAMAALKELRKISNLLSEM